MFLDIRRPYSKLDFRDVAAHVKALKENQIYILPANSLTHHDPHVSKTIRRLYKLIETS